MHKNFIIEARIVREENGKPHTWEINCGQWKCCFVTTNFTRSLADLACEIEDRLDPESAPNGHDLGHRIYGKKEWRL